MNKFASYQPRYNTGIVSVSWSRLKNFETCARRYHEIDILKNFKEKPSPELIYGNEMHDALRYRVSHNTPLPDGFAALEKWVEFITIDSSDPNVGIQVELELCIGKDLKPRDYKDFKEGWFRCKIDFLKLKHFPDYQLALAVDYKSGEPKPDIPQLGLMAQAVFAHYPKVRACKTLYIWTKVDDTTEENIYPRDMVDLWGALNPRFQRLEDAHRNGNFPPTKSGLCKAWCAVTTCEYNGKR